MFSILLPECGVHNRHQFNCSISCFVAAILLCFLWREEREVSKTLKSGKFVGQRTMVGSTIDVEPISIACCGDHGMDQNLDVYLWHIHLHHNRQFCMAIDSFNNENNIEIIMFWQSKALKTGFHRNSVCTRFYSHIRYCHFHEQPNAHQSIKYVAMEPHSHMSLLPNGLHGTCNLPHIDRVRLIILVQRSKQILIIFKASPSSLTHNPSLLACNPLHDFCIYGFCTSIQLATRF